jgi:phosphatidylethanolamine-binding protein (PEBP) family uncharacterized protein
MIRIVATRRTAAARMCCIAALWAATAGCSSGTTPSSADAAIADASTGDAASGAFALTGIGFSASGLLPSAHTCDGAGVSPALAWSGAPANTAEFALLVTTVAPVGPGAPTGIKWNWVLYGIPNTTAALAEASSGVGQNGITSDGPKLAYAPPCSQGPGAKPYTFTLYALSAAPTLPSSASQVTGPTLEAAIASRTLAAAAFTVTYAR